MPFLDEINTHKKELAVLYDLYLTNDIVKPKLLDSGHLNHIYNIRTEKRDALKQFLLKNGIHTEIHYPVPPNQQECYQKHFLELNFTISEEIHNTTLSLPISFSTTKEDVLLIIECINSFFKNV